MKLRWYQEKYLNAAFSAWDRGIINYAAVSPTGSGKTPLIASVIQKADVQTVVYAHRKELVTQLSLTLARFGIEHRIIGSQSAIRDSVKLHLKYLQASHYDPSAKIAVASVDTVVARIEKNKLVEKFLKDCELQIVDECHHVLRENKWGLATTFSPTAKGFFVTATLERSDGKGLGRHTDGVIDAFDEFVSLGDLIAENFLTRFEVMVPPNDFNREEFRITASGDVSKKQLVESNKKRPIVGDVVTHYLDHNRGKRNIVYATSLAEASEYELAFKKQNVPAQVIEGSMGDLDRYELMDKFRDGKVLNLISVDLIGEGVDVPAVEGISMGRLTKSYPLFVQQLGRPLRLSEGKDRALVLDHVGNVPDLGLSCLHTGRATLERTVRERPDIDAMEIVTCVNPACLKGYDAELSSCPYCGHKEYKSHKVRQSNPAKVQGDLALYTDDFLQSLHKKIDKSLRNEDTVRAALNHMPHMPEPARLSAIKKHKDRRLALIELRDAIAHWLGCAQFFNGMTRRQSQRAFFRKWGMCVLTAQTQTGPAMVSMAEKIKGDKWGSS